MGNSEKNSPDLIGSCGLFKWHHAWKRCAVGYELAANETGQGYLSEALATILDWAFQHTELNRIEALVHAVNAPSTRVLTGLTFTQEGLLRQCGYWQEQFHDMLMFGLLKQDWLNKK